MTFAADVGVGVTVASCLIHRRNPALQSGAPLTMRSWFNQAGNESAVSKGRECELRIVLSLGAPSLEVNGGAKFLGGG